MSLNNISANLRKAFIEYMKELEQTEETNMDESSSNNNSVNNKTDFDNDASIFSGHMDEFKDFAKQVFAKQTFTKMNLSKKDIEYVVDILAGNSAKGDETKIDEADEKVDEKVKEMSEAKNTDTSATNTSETNTTNKKKNKLLFYSNFHTAI